MSQSDVHPVTDLERLLEAAAVDAARGAAVAEAIAADPSRLLAAAEAIRTIAARSAGAAITAADFLVAAADAHGDPGARAAARRAASRAHAWAGDFDPAIAAAEAAAAIADSAGVVEEAARARLSLMHPLTERGRLDDALAAGDDAHAIASAGGRPDLAARADINVGIALRRRDRAADAVVRFDRARPHVQAEPAILASLDNSRGEALVLLQRFDEAHAAFIAAARGFAATGADLQASIVEGNLADLALRRGHLHTALQRFERARRGFAADEHAVHRARILAEEAEARGLVGMHELSVDGYAAAIPLLDRFGLVLEAARARAGLGAALPHIGRHSEAATALAAAAAAFDQLGHRTERGRCDLVRATLELAGGRRAEARRLALAAAAAFDARPADAAATRLILGEIAVADGSVELADAEFAGALALARQMDLAPVLADVLVAIGRHRRGQGDLDGAAVSLDEAVDRLERIRGTLQAGRLRTAFLGARTSAYDERLACRLAAAARARSTASGVGSGSDASADVDLGGVAGVLQAAELRSDRGLLDDLVETEGRAARGDREAARPGPCRSGDAADLALSLARERAALNLSYSRISDQLHTGLAEDGAGVRDAAREQERRVADLSARLEATGRTTRSGRPVELSALQAGLGPTDRLLRFIVSEGSVTRITIASDGAAIDIGIADVVEIDAAVRRVRLQIGRGLRRGANAGAGRGLDDAVAAARSLGAQLLDGVDLDGVRRMLVVPEGPIALVPPGMLHDGSGFLADRMETALAPSAGVAHRLAVRPRPTGGHHVLIGVPDAAAPRIADEIEALHAADPGARICFGAEATVDAVTAAAESASRMHLACHGRFDPRDPSASGLRLADRWISVGELAALRLDAELVTLSGCETGLVSAAEAGGGPIGLGRALLGAGARRVVASLWPVDDAITRDVMVALHGPAADAAVDPVAALRTEHPHPAHWAPFVSMGGFRHVDA